MKNLLKRSAALALCLLSPPLISAQVSSSSASGHTGDWAELASFHYGIGANIPYVTINNSTSHLDVWENHASKVPVPVLIYIHGGGWVFGDKGRSPNSFLPYSERGGDVVNG